MIEPIQGPSLYAGDYEPGWSVLSMGNAHRSRAGVIVDEREALSLPAALAATRIISETIASLPCRMKELVDERTTRNAVNRVEYRVVNRQPNPEMDRFMFWDMQIPHTMNWGNSFAEKERDANERVISLWPIHPCRIPAQNIVRQGQGRGRTIKAGQPGDVFYLVRNDDGTETPVPRRDMLHIVGVLPEHGLYGRSLIEWGSEPLGVGVATQRHVSAFYRNGGTPDVILTFPMPLKHEKKMELRQSWQQMHQGADNAHRMVVLDGGGEIKIPQFSPEAQQLIDTRKFNVHDIARIYRVPVSMLASIDAAPRANVEQENLSFVRDTIRPWVERFELALLTQLLPNVSQNKFEFKFDLSALSRGDMQARANFYKTMFELGGMSPDDIRNAEDLNPIENGMGSRYFIAGNNMVPLDRVDEMMTLQQQQPEPMPTESDDDDSEEMDDSEQAIRQFERNAVRTMKQTSAQRPNGKTYEQRLEEFYAPDGKFVRAAAEEYGDADRAEAHRIQSVVGLGLARTDGT